MILKAAKSNKAMSSTFEDAAPVFEDGARDEAASESASIENLKDETLKDIGKNWLERAVFTAINDGDADGLRAVFAQAAPVDALQLLLTTAYPNRDNFYVHDDASLCDADTLLGPRFVVSNAVSSTSTHCTLPVCLATRMLRWLWSASWPPSLTASMPERCCTSSWAACGETQTQRCIWLPFWAWPPWSVVCSTSALLQTGATTVATGPSTVPLTTRPLLSSPPSRSPLVPIR